MTETTRRRLERIEQAAAMTDRAQEPPRVLQFINPDHTVAQTLVLYPGRGRKWFSGELKDVPPWTGDQPESENPSCNGTVE